MLPHFHLSGIHGFVVFLYVVAIFGALHLAAASKPESKYSQAWLGLGF